MSALLQVNSLCKLFKERTSFFDKHEFYAVKDLSFSLAQQKTLAVIGNNGSGKSMLAKMIVGITEPTSGRIFFDGKPLTFGDYQYRAKYIRMVFQDPNFSFNPRLNVGQILDVPLRLTTELDEQERNIRIFDTLRLVGLYPDHANVSINTMSVSQKQRVALAQALILNPKVIIADDALSILDASVKSQLVNLMLDIQEKRGISYIYVGQHLGIIKHIADEVLVMDEGKMVEYGKAQTLFCEPQHEVTRRLVEGFFGRVLDKQSWQPADWVG